jgi:hypothetical protein
MLHSIQHCRSDILFWLPSHCRSNITAGQERRPLRNIWRTASWWILVPPPGHKHFTCDRLGTTYDACKSSAHTSPSRSVWYTAVEKNADFFKVYSDCSKTSRDMKQLPALICIRRLYLLNNACKHLISFYVWVSVRHKTILYQEPTRCNFGSMFISHCKIILHVSDAFCVHHQEWLLIQFLVLLMMDTESVRNM